ncbi:RagB/SusD family nutrient uptake outer membrane protein [Sphingobacterium arenae]|uniref:RagB/SusD family nutrient uptake outer membrane protein n=1 Tax=Sphingobacterium arenae TaxID=1280598 RepID=A0ABR7Y132_9SPHI|nr:RagB/SusD family nutrient uptake outer membrane protein [Sphingobacterium arenae]MBD1425013.1 RagB/SusD family nutrient uptake outer membrane protein [Sphingobacterium arenae]
MKTKFIFMISLLVVLTSCESFLDKRDPTATTFEEFFNTEADLQRVTYSSYLDFFTPRDNRRLLFYMKDGRSDDAYARVEGDHHLRIANGNINANTRAFEYYYTLHMKHIGRINMYIANIDKPYLENEAVRQKYKAILEGLRVWHYFEATTRWGNIPFLLEPATIEEAKQPPLPQAEILDKLFEMSDNIISRLPSGEYSTDKHFLNKESFKTLVMRYALYHGRYELAARLAQEVMESGRYELYPNYGDLFQYAGASSNKEFIQHHNLEAVGANNTWSFRDLGPHFRTGNGQSYSVPTKALVDAYWTLQGRPIDDCPLHSKEEYELDPKLNRDPRYQASIMGHGDIFYGEEIDIYTPGQPMYYQNLRASKSGYWYRKFVPEEDAFRNGNLVFGITRYAEVLLTYAEAKIMQDDIDALAKDCINQVRRRAGLDMSYADVTLSEYSAYNQQQWIDLVRNERRTEFAGEGMRYDDIIRWKIAEDVLNKPALGHTRMVGNQKQTLHIENRTFAPHNYLWPHHALQLKIEPDLVQNPGY